MNRDEALTFCELLYGNSRLADEGLQIEVASITPGKRGKLGYTFCQTPAYAADTAIKIAQEGSNAYAGLSLVDPKTMKGKRGTVEDARAIVGFWSDIDIADPLAPKPGKNPPINEDEAYAIANGVGTPPSLVIHSGHGLHAYWLFDEPWIFGSDEERRVAADTVKAWELTLQQVAREHGRSLDSVGDLARVLRIPGTVNTKNPEHPVEVRIDFPRPQTEWMTAWHYKRTELERFIRAPAPAQAGDVLKVEKLENVEFRFPDELERAKMESKIAIACMNDRTFKETWDHDRVDFASNQASASEYDMSLANQTMASGWSDQEVYWIILLWRERHGQDTEKVLKRTDYIELTLAKARKDNVVAVSLRQIREVDAIVDQIMEAPAPVTEQAKKEHEAKVEAQKVQAFVAVSGLIGRKITGFHRDGTTSGATYYLEFNSPRKKRVNCGPSGDLFNVNELRSNVCDQAKLVIGGINRNEWFEAVNLMMKFLTEDENPYLDPNHRWLSYLISYVEQAPHITATPKGKSEDDEDGTLGKERDNLGRCMVYKKPFVLNGVGEPTIWFNLEAFRNYAQKSYNDKTLLPEMTAALRRLGAHPKRRTVQYDGKRIDRFLWGITSNDLKKRMNEIQRALELHQQPAESYTNNVEETPAP
jgi:hypothetical protein